MTTYIDRIMPLIDNLIILVGKPNLPYIEAMSSINETAIASSDDQITKDDLLFVYETTLASLKQLQTNLPPRTKHGFTTVLQQLIDLHVQLLTE
jgi:hypothetical protein